MVKIKFTRYTFLLVFAGCTSLLGMLGCGNGLATDYSNIGLIDVDGTVKLDGQPVEGAVVFFESDNQSFSYATTDADGYYEMKFNSEKSGVVPGAKTVRISTTAQTGETEEVDEDGSVDGQKRTSKRSQKTDLFPASYNKDSQLQVNVSDQEHEFHFDLNSDVSSTGTAG